MSVGSAPARAVLCPTAAVKPAAAVPRHTTGTFPDRPLVMPVSMMSPWAALKSVIRSGVAAGLALIRP
ncbi:hypothetical protein D3C76_1356950 [compost metagenome]